MLRRHLLKFLAAVFCLSQLTLAVSAQTPTGSYSDVPIESPHYEAIEYLTDMGVTTTSQFSLKNMLMSFNTSVGP